MKHHRPVYKEDTPIAIANEDYLVLYCFDCNYKLLHRGMDIYVCGHCGIEYFPEKNTIKHGEALETWDGPIEADGSVNTEMNVSYIPEPPEARIMKNKPLKGTFAALQGSSRTLHFTSYTTNEREEEDEEEEN